MSLLLQMTLFLGAVLIIVPFLNRLGVATVLGYLITGIILGPSVFHVANDPQAIQKIAEFGVILLMFIIGLELRPQRLWALRQSIFGMGSLQVGITGLIFSVIAWLIFSPTIATSLVIGFALAFSSTAFVLQLLAEKNLLKSIPGQQSFSILLFQDMAAIPLIAAIPLVAGTESTHHGIAYFAAILATFSGLFLFSRYLMRPFFRYVARSGARELITAVGLFIVCAVVFLMDTLGISTTLGAFLTGVLLADSEFRHELEASLAPFKGLLLGLFFMAIGMTTQLSILLENPLLILGGALLLIAIKMAVMVSIARYLKNTWQNSLLLATFLAQGGEFAFVVFNIAQSEKVLTDAIVQPLNLIVVLSMILTPALYWVVQKIISQQKSVSLSHETLSQPPTPLMLLGFGRMGQIIARVAHMQHLPFTAIDNNLEKVDFVRHYGGTLFYGDATSPDVLISAGIQHAKTIVLAIDDIEDSMNVARHLRLNYPDTTLLVRARDRHHVHLLRDLGIEHIWRETYLSALDLGRVLLQNCGISEQDAKQTIALFREYDEDLLSQQQQHIYGNEQKLYETHRNAITELEHLFENDAIQIMNRPTTETLEESQTTKDALS